MGVVVVADDDPDLQVIICRLVAQCGHRAMVVGDGASALRLVRAHRPDLVILDNDMPGLTGREVAAALRADDATRHVPVLLVSGGVTAEECRTGIANVTACMAKPFRAAELQARIDQLIDAPVVAALA